MEEIRVNTASNDYPIVFEKNFVGLKELVKNQNLLGRKFCIISDTNVAPLYLHEIENILKNTVQDVYTYIFPAGEEHKTLQTISDFYSFFIENHFDRKTVVVALGGGVCGDMVGFASATYLRGITFIQVPTTLLAQVDSSVGGKTGVDFMGAKNMIGSFYQPSFVYININSLQTLPDREYFAGIAEVIKYGYILSQPFYSYLQQHKDKIVAKDTDTLQYIIKECCQLKAKVVSEDEKENGLREILNFGHTIGHSIETCKDFTLLHGECVGLGILAALHISMNRNYISNQQLEECFLFLKKMQLPTKVDGIALEQIYNQMFLDKKVKNGKINFVLLSKIGSAYCTTDVSKKEIQDAILSVL